MKIVRENISFERDTDPKKGLRIGKYKPIIKRFKGSDGEEEEIEVIDDTFHTPSEMEVKLVFGERDDHEIADVYVDGQKSDVHMFFMTPAEYEFFVPNKPTVEIDGEYQSDPNPENWSKTDSAYGFPLVDKNDKAKLKEMQEKHGYWYASSGDYDRQHKDPFIAAAQLILFTY